jgi:YcxB-like protein
MLRTYYLVFGAGLAIGALLSLVNLLLGLFVLIFSALVLLTTRLDVLDRLFGRRRARSVLDQPIELNFDDDGIVWHGPQGTSHVPWSSLTEVRSNERTVIFVRDRLLVAYAPASAFANDAERADVIAFSRDRIAAAKASAP